MDKIILNGHEFEKLEYGLIQLRDEFESFIENEWDKANDSPLDIFIEKGMDENEINESQFAARQYWLRKYLVGSNKIHVDTFGDEYVNLTKLQSS